MMTVEEFAKAHPEHAFNFEAPMGGQPRIYDQVWLEGLPVELTPTHPYRPGGRTRPNLNQTRTHHQCATCLRVLRNDFFWAPPSHVRQNIVHTHCKECAALAQEQRYAAQTELLRERRLLIWRTIAPRCAVCGFDRHPAAIDMHHLGQKEELMSKLVAQLAATPSPRNAKRLLAEAAGCVPLCSNCHRLLHAGVIELTVKPSPPATSTDALLHSLIDLGGIKRTWQPDLFDR
jgi:hypothetical protein